jgi:hypothetical protein
MHFAAAAVLALLSLSATAIEVYQSRPVEVYRGSGTIEPYRGSGTIEPYGGAQQQKRPAPARPTEADVAALFGVWQTNVPGAVYTVPSDRTGYDRLVVSSGAASGLFQLHPDGTYRWNSYGAAKRGRWVRTGDAGYPVEVIDTVEKRRWKVGFDKRRQIIRLWDGYVWYDGRRAQIRQR